MKLSRLSVVSTSFSPALLVALATVVGSIGAAGCAADGTDETPAHASEALGDGVNVPNPSGAYFANITANGTGCPAGTWQAAISPDGAAFTVTFSGYEATMKPGDAFVVKDCTLAINLKTPEG